MLTGGNRLHFINRADKTNCGDWECCPLTYYLDFFKQYSVMRHDIRYVELDAIAPTDVVILGGGGLFDFSECCNRAINKILDTGAAVIAWSPGFNTHNGYDGTYSTKINFEKFALLGVRDYENAYNLEYLPDITCKLPGLKQKYVTKRKYGVARHKDYPIHTLKMYDEITNGSSLDDILQFIGESEIIISNSFHLIYWSILLGKKTVCVSPFSTKFFSYKYRPAYCDLETENLSERVQQAKSYAILDECIRENDRFFDRVKGLIERKLSPVEKANVSLEHINDKVLWNGYVRDTQVCTGDALASQLFIDTGEGFTEKQKRIAINNVIGDEVCCVTFNLSEYSGIKSLRFDPIEGHACEVEIVSAMSDAGEVTLVPRVFVQHNEKQLFFTTDPQYFIDYDGSSFLEIHFRLRVLSMFEAEQSAREYFEYSEKYCAALEDTASKQRIHIEECESKILNIDSERSQLKDNVCELSRIIEHKDSALDGQKNLIQQRDLTIDEQASAIEQKDLQMNEQANVIEQQQLKLDEQAGVIEQKDLQLSGQVTAIEQQSLIISEQMNVIAQLNFKMDGQWNIIEQYRNQIQQLSSDLNEKNEQLNQSQQQIESQRVEIDSLYHSRSWRITAPLRNLLLMIKKIWKGTPRI